MGIWEENTVEVNSTRIHYYSHCIGSNLPLIFLHGYMDNGLCFDRIADRFLDTYDIYLLDAPGHGQSSDPVNSKNNNDLIESLHTFCAVNELKDCIFIGHSMGGVQAAVFASLYPDLTKAIIMEDPAFFFQTRRSFANLAEVVMSLLFPHQSHPKSLAEFEKRAKKQNPKWVEPDQLVWAKANREFGLHYPGKDVKMLMTLGKAEKILPKINVPILLITSQHGIVSQRVAKHYQEISNNLQWQFVPNAGHSIRREQFELYIEAVKKFIFNL